jgi:CRP/FNR family transcriptional regulator
MQIEIDLLIAWGGVSQKFKKNEFIFMEGHYPHFYHQIIDGNVKMFSTDTDGKELIQGMFSVGDSFGEPPLFIQEAYPATALALHDSVIIRVAKDNFMKILEEYPQIQKSFLVLFAHRIFNKALKSKILAQNEPENRILAFLKAYKKNKMKENSDLKGQIIIPFTRQEIADFTGLRVETVIRTLKVMDTQHKVKIYDKKVYY